MTTSSAAKAVCKSTLPSFHTLSLFNPTRTKTPFFCSEDMALSMVRFETPTCIASVTMSSLDCWSPKQLPFALFYENERYSDAICDIVIFQPSFCVGLKAAYLVYYCNALKKHNLTQVTWGWCTDEPQRDRTFDPQIKSLLLYQLS